MQVLTLVMFTKKQNLFCSFGNHCSSLVVSSLKGTSVDKVLGLAFLLLDWFVIGRDVLLSKFRFGLLGFFWRLGLFGEVFHLRSFFWWLLGFIYFLFFLVLFYYGLSSGFIR